MGPASRSDRAAALMAALQVSPGSTASSRPSPSAWARATSGAASAKMRSNSWRTRSPLTASMWPRFLCRLASVPIDMLSLRRAS